LLIRDSGLRRVNVQEHHRAAVLDGTRDGQKMRLRKQSHRLHHNSRQNRHNKPQNSP
jgi:hypothetical protein